jgi:peptide-methionine (S)-S-oxide reductase
MEKATFAAGCFWGVEHKLAKVPGVTATAVGYMGGQMHKPTYEDVCADDTGHAEVAQVDFDPAKVSFETLVRKFYDLHDPTQLNRQGPDQGTQYRSAVFYHSPEQKAVAERVTAELNRARFRGGIVTQIVPAAEFWRAEEYHQKYGEKHPGHHCTL